MPLSYGNNFSFIPAVLLQEAPYTYESQQSLNNKAAYKREGSVSRSFTPGNIAITPRRLTRVFDQIKSLTGSKLEQTHSSGTTFSIAAANKNRTQGLNALSTSVIAHFTSNETIPVYAAYIHNVTFIGNKPFSVVPFVALLENGESISSSDSASAEPVVAAKAAISGGNFIIAFGNIYEATRKYEASLLYRQDLSMNLAGWCNRYSDYYKAKLLAEEEAAAKVLVIGAVTVGEASTTITYDGATYEASFQATPDNVSPIKS